MKGGGKGMTTGGFKGYGKGGGTKEDLKVMEKGVVTKGECFKCGKVGHKAVECSVYMVGEMRPEEEKPIGEVRNVGIPWMVAGVAEVF